MGFECQHRQSASIVKWGVSRRSQASFCFINGGQCRGFHGS